MIRCVTLMLALLAPILAGADESGLRPYVFSVDGELLAPKRIAVESGAGFNGVTGAGAGIVTDETRSAQSWVGAAAGLLPRVELDGAFAYRADSANNLGFTQARLDLRVQLLTPRRRFPVAIAAGAGYQADALFDHAITGVVAASAYLGRVQLTANVRLAHYFASGRDPLDVFVTAGALVRATSWLRVGGEYVGEELEGLDGAERDDAVGGRHYVGPTAVIFLARSRLRLNATGGAVFVPGQAGALVRGSLAYLF